MCGIAGFYHKASHVSEPLEILKNMGSVIQHRGPDDHGEWYDASLGLGLVHRRLSIVDLSSSGHQPMLSNSHRYNIVFNGEIYNHLVLRAEIESLHNFNAWVGHSDTETLLCCIEYFGLEETLKKITGMFSFALFDNVNSELILARDRVGEKPLYYGWQDDVFLFGSELKSLEVHPSFKKVINRDSLTLLLRHNYIPTPHCIWSNINKLVPGSFLRLNLNSNKSSLKKYWDFISVANANKFDLSSLTHDDITSRTETILSDAVKNQMHADVPLGAFLSGGVDSSLIVSLMQNHSTTPIKTFSIGFDEEMYNEAEFAKKVADHLGTDHTELYVSSNDALSIIKDLPKIYDEPFADSSSIPTFIVSRLAKNNVTVCLSGDGGDELFCGYNRYIMTQNLWSKLNLLPVFIRKLISFILLSIRPKIWDFVGNIVYKVLPISKPAYFGDKVHKAAFVLPSRSSTELYKHLVSLWKNPEDVVLLSTEPSTFVNGFSEDIIMDSAIEKMMAVDTLTYLPDDILTKVDRASMAVSLETRVPFLDHKLIEHSWRIPLSLKYCNGKSKWLLRKILYKYVPKNLIERPKMGFGVPLDSWLRGPLKDWAENLLSEERLKREGFFAVEIIREKWTEHLSGKYNWSHHLWSILMFQLWLEAQGGDVE